MFGFEIQPQDMRDVLQRYGDIYAALTRECDELRGALSLLAHLRVEARKARAAMPTIVRAGDHQLHVRYRTDKRPPTLLRDHQTFGLEHSHRAAHRRPAGLVLLRQLPLGAETVARSQTTSQNSRSKIINDAVVREDRTPWLWHWLDNTKEQHAGSPRRDDGTWPLCPSCGGTPGGSVDRSTRAADPRRARSHHPRHRTPVRTCGPPVLSSGERLMT